jgi:hypothetical protein
MLSGPSRFVFGFEEPLAERLQKLKKTPARGSAQSAGKSASEISVVALCKYQIVFSRRRASVRFRC